MFISTLLFLAFILASSNALSLISLTVTKESNSFFKVIPIHPLPVPISSIDILLSKYFLE